MMETLSANYLKDPLLITDTDYVSYTMAWQTLLHEKNPNPLNPYFQINGSSMFSVLFSRIAIINLLSTTGITTVKARFCIVSDPAGNSTFNIVLYGADTNGITKSAYYLGQPCTEDYLGGKQGGNIPDWLAQQWINEWRNNYTGLYKPIPSQIFDTMFGPLQGYKYDMFDFLDAFYKNTNPVDDFLCFHFAIHEHYMPGVTDTADKKSTFNTVMQGISDQSNLSNNLFYDISSPCPPCY